MSRILLSRSRSHTVFLLLILLTVLGVMASSTRSIMYSIAAFSPLMPSLNVFIPSQFVQIQDESVHFTISQGA